MLSASLGWDWRTIEAGAWMQIPLPPSIRDNEDSRWSCVLDKEQWLREHWHAQAIGKIAEEISQAEHSINHEVYTLYGLSDQEIILVEDAVKYTILPLLQRKTAKFLQAITEPAPEQLAMYAKRVCLQLNGILYQGDFELTATIFTVQKAPITACRFALRKRSDAPLVIESKIAGIHDILGQISEHLRAKVADHLYVHRDLRIYDSDTFWVIKPSESRLWSEAAALNDADAVVREHMEQLPNG
jgi:hypothetical protein